MATNVSGTPPADEENYEFPSPAEFAERFHLPATAEPSPADDSISDIAELVERMGSPETAETLWPSSGWWISACSMLLDAAERPDATTFSRLVDAVREVRRRWHAAFGPDQSSMDVVHKTALFAELCRLGHSRALATVDVTADSNAGRVLKALALTPGLSGTALSETTGLDGATVSRTANKLGARGILARDRRGRAVAWRLTAAGQRAVAAMDERDGRSQLVDPFPDTRDLVAAVTRMTIEELESSEMSTTSDPHQDAEARVSASLEQHFAILDDLGAQSMMLADDNAAA